MAIPADCCWEVRQNGSDTLCGGGFSVASKGATGVDYTVQDAAKYTYTATLSATSTATLTGVGFTNDILGNVIQITGQGSYCVTGFTSSTAVTVDRALGTFSGATGYIGGGFATPGKAASVLATSNTIFIKGNNTYSCSSSANVAGGRINISNFGPLAWVGYVTNRTLFNTDRPRPILKPTANSMTVLTWAGAGGCVSNIEFANPGSQTGCTAVDCSGGGRVSLTNLKITGVATGITSSSSTQVMQCEVSASFLAIGVGDGSLIYGSSVHDGAGVTLGSSAGGHPGAMIVDSLIYNITNGSSLQLQSNCVAINCSVYNVTSGVYGVQFASSADGACAYNCIVTDCQTVSTAYGYGATNNVNTNQQIRLVNCAGYNNRTADYDSSAFTTGLVVGFINLTASPWTVAGSNFALNNTAGGGAACRAAGILGAFPSGGTSYHDLGAMQHQAAAGGGVVHLAGQGGGLVG